MEELHASGLQRPLIMPLGDTALLVRFASGLDEAANRAALALARQLREHSVAGILEIVPSLVSVLVRYDPEVIQPTRLAGEIALHISGREEVGFLKQHRIGVRFGGTEGPDLEEVAAALGLTPAAFVEQHCARPLLVLTTGFAPGFVYCGFHPEPLALPRRTQVRPVVPAGSVLFAARQTAVSATDIPTGWHVIGRTDFRNFDPGAMPPTVLTAGDEIVFEAIA